jgi:asparagine synthetase B (glutamine-hydrolysing)
MCGIVGIFDCVGKRAVVPAVLERMNERQHHRGPDGGGVHIEPGVGLGHRRLAIIDVANRTVLAPSSEMPSGIASCVATKHAAPPAAMCSRYASAIW